MVAPNVAELAFAKQTAKGSAAATAAHRLLLAGGTLPHESITNAWFEETTGQRMRYDRYVQEAHIEGEPQYHVMPVSLVELLRGALGTIVTTGIADPYTHTITPALTQPWYTFWAKLSTLVYRKNVDAKIKSIVIHGESGQPLTITVNLLGVSPLALTQATYDTQAGATAKELTFRFRHYDGAGALLVEGVAVASINSFDITIENNSNIEQGDSLTPHDVSEGGLEVTVRASQLFTSADLLNRIGYGAASPADNAAVVNNVLELAGTPSGLQFTWTRQGTPERSLRIAIPRVSVNPFFVQPSTSPSPALRADITYMAHQPADDSAAITATVKNGSAAAVYP